MMQAGTMLAAMLMVLTRAPPLPKRKCAPFLCSRGLERTTSIPHRMVRCSPRHRFRAIRLP